MPAVPPRSCPRPRRVTLRLDEATYAVLVQLAEADAGPAARMAAVLMRRALTLAAPVPRLSAAAQRVLERRRRRSA